MRVSEAMPDVSVVIPTRGRPELLQRAIRSALQQGGVPLEVIVVVDGEDAITARMVEGMGDARVRTVVLEAPVGGSEARNVGAREARGRYVALLDDDDEWMPDKLARQVAVADATRAETFVVVTQYLYRVEGEPDEVWPGHLPGKGEALSEFLFSSRGGFQTSTYLCPRELLLRVPFTKGLKKHQDWDWFLQLAAMPGFELKVVAEPLSIYWVPLRTRSSVSGKLDWRFSYEWARSRRSLMTRVAYGRFLVKICTRSAVMQRAGAAVYFLLFRELLLAGRPTPKLLGEFAACLVIPEGMRLRLRAMILRWRPPKAPARAELSAVRGHE